MFGSLTVSSDHWRHFIPFAPNITVQCVIGKTVDISLKPYMIQGARDFFDHSSPDDEVLPVRVPVQRGWLLDYMATVQPKLGEVTNMTFLNGFTYRPFTSGDNSVDCFNYQFSNGTQLSNYGKITINLIKPFIPNWRIWAATRSEVTGKNPARFSMHMGVVPNHSSFHLDRVHGYIWYYDRIYVDANGYVRKVKTMIQRYEFYTDWDRRVTVLDRAATVSMRSWRTDSHIVGIDPKTNLIYRPTNKFPMIYCELWNFPYDRYIRLYTYYNWSIRKWVTEGYWVPDLSRPEVYEMLISDQHTRDWNISGKIILPAN